MGDDEVVTSFKGRSFGFGGGSGPTYRSDPEAYSAEVQDIEFALPGLDRGTIYVRYEQTRDIGFLDGELDITDAPFEGWSSIHSRPCTHWRGFASIRFPQSIDLL